MTDLFAALCARNPAAFRSLVSHLVPRLRSFLQRLGPESEVNDVIQETLLKVFLEIRSVRHPEFFETWMFAIAKRLMLTIRRRLLAGRRMTEHVRRLPPPPSPPDPLAAAEGAELLDRLASSVQALPTEQGEAFIIRVAYGRDYEDVARRQNTPLGTAIWRVHAARLALRERLAA